MQSIFTFNLLIDDFIHIKSVCIETVEYTLLSHVHGKMDIRSLSHGMGKYQICNCAYTRARYSCKKASVVNAITEPHICSNIINRKNTIIIYSRIFLRKVRSHQGKLEIVF